MPTAKLICVSGMLRAVRASRNRLPSDVLSLWCGAMAGAVVGNPASKSSSSSFMLSDNKSAACASPWGASALGSVAGVAGFEGAVRGDLRLERDFALVVADGDALSAMTVLMVSTSARMVHGLVM